MLVKLYLTRDTNTDGGAAPCHSDFAEVLSQNLTDPSLKYPIAYSTRVTPYMEPLLLLFEREQAFKDGLLIRQPLRTSVLSGHIFRRQHLRILRLALHTSLARWPAAFMRSVVAQFSCMSSKAFGVVSACQPQLSGQLARSKGCYIEQRYHPSRTPV